MKPGYKNLNSFKDSYFDFFKEHLLKTSQVCSTSIKQMKNLFRVNKVIILIIIFSFILAGCPSGRKKGGPSTGGYGSSKSYNYWWRI